jgi:hypothetical protein
VSVSDRKRTGLYLAHDRRLFLEEMPRLGCSAVVVRSPEDLLLDEDRSERFLKTRRGLYLAWPAWASLARVIQPGLRRRLERLRRPVTPKDCLLRRGRSELFIKVWNDAIRSHFANVKGRSLLVRHGQALTSVSNDYVLLSPWELWSSLNEQAERLGLSFFAASARRALPGWRLRCVTVCGPAVVLPRLARLVSGPRLPCRTIIV